MPDDVLPSQPFLPSPPGHDASFGQYMAYVQRLVLALVQDLTQVHLRVENRLLQGTAAQKPAASGSLRMFWVTDGTPHLEIDVGTWTAV